MPLLPLCPMCKITQGLPQSFLCALNEFWNQYNLKSYHKILYIFNDHKLTNHIIKKKTRYREKINNIF